MTLILLCLKLAESIKVCTDTQKKTTKYLDPGKIFNLLRCIRIIFASPWPVRYVMYYMGGWVLGLHTMAHYWAHTMTTIRTV